jgi:triosephosphate isomerase
MRKQIVAGNWKMNKTLDQGLQLVSEIVNMVQDEVHNGALVVLCPPYTHLQSVVHLTKGRTNVFVGAQNCSDKASGAFTGEVSAEMLASMGVQYVILGHSERREYFAETNAQLAAKVNLALANGLKPIFCCGETLVQRQEQDYKALVCEQLTESLFHLSADQITGFVIAYEPIWAIGTGLTASKEQAQEMHLTIRDHFAAKYGAEVAASISILYGGSAKPSNAPELFANPDVDGGLIGGASLLSRDFTDIVKAL